MSRPPNILWIITTQWRARAFGHAGDANARTAALDGLIARGVRYASAVTPHPFGPFVRAALLTGLPSPANGVREYFDPLPAGARTIAHALQDRGYATAWIGKWHLARRDPSASLVGEAHARMIVPPEARGGFSHWEGFESGFLLNDPYVHGTGLPEPVRLPGYQSEVLAERAFAWIHEHGPRDRPWFCAVSLEPPHPPYDAPAPAEAIDPESIVLAPNVPRGGEVERQARRELAGYYRHIAATDQALGRFVDRVGEYAERCGRPTRVVITSVHGDMHGAHGRFRKGWPYEESVVVPLAVLDLAGTTRAGVDSRPVSLLDLPAMALAWADGRGWVPAGGPAAISMPSAVRLPHQCDRVWTGRRSEAWKVIVDPESREPWLVFDLERDPWDIENLAACARGATLVRASGLAP